MVTELRQILRETVEDAPTGGIDHAAVLRAGRDRVRRRRRAGMVAAAAAVVIVTGAVLVPGERPAKPAEHVLPAAPVRLSLDDARPVEPEIVARTRTVQGPGDAIDYDRIDGITDDGLVLRARWTWKGDISEYGLVDPDTGSTDWLPTPPWDIGEPLPLALGADRLLFLESRHVGQHHTLIFDRTTRTWTRPRLELPAAERNFFGLYGQLGDDERVYFPRAGDVRRYDWSKIIARRQWWSAPAAGGTARHETALDGLSVTWSDSARATADRGGRIVVTEQGASRTLAWGVPAGCEGFPYLSFAGHRMIARYVCDGHQLLVVLDESGKPELSIEVGWLWVIDANDRFALIGGEPGTYVLDLEQQRLMRLGEGPLDTAMDRLPTPVVNGDLVAWNEPGPTDSNKVSDIVYRVGRLP